MIMFIFGLVVLVVNDFVDFNFMSSNYLKKECWIGLARRRSARKKLQEASFHDRFVSVYKKDLGRRERWRKERRTVDRERKVEKGAR